MFKNRYVRRFLNLDSELFLGILIVAGAILGTVIGVSLSSFIPR